MEHQTPLDNQAPPPAYNQLNQQDPRTHDVMDRKEAPVGETEPPDYYTPGEAGMIKYNMYYTTSRLNVRLHEGLESSPTKYYAESESFTLKPFYFLRKGDSKESPMVSFVKFKLYSRHMEVGRGDYKHDPDHNIVWSKLEREKWLLQRSDYTFTTSEGSPGMPQKYTWHKDKSSRVSTTYVCTDPNGRTVSKMLSGGLLNWKKAGELEVLGSLDEGLREILLASALGIWTMEMMDYQSMLKSYPSDSSKGK